MQYVEAKIFQIPDWRFQVKLEGRRKADISSVWVYSRTIRIQILSEQAIQSRASSDLYSDHVRAEDHEYKDKTFDYVCCTDFPRVR